MANIVLKKGFFIFSLRKKIVSWILFFTPIPGSLSTLIEGKLSSLVHILYKIFMT